MIENRDGSGEIVPFTPLISPRMRAAVNSFNVPLTEKVSRGEVSPRVTMWPYGAPRPAYAEGTFNVKLAASVSSQKAMHTPRKQQETPRKLSPEMEARASKLASEWRYYREGRVR